MLVKHNMLAVNQLNAQIKLTEVWKAINDEDHPFKLTKTCSSSVANVTRSITNGVLKSTANSDGTQRTFINDGIKAWNLAPKEIKKFVSFTSAKAAIKTFVKTLPI